MKKFISTLLSSALIFTLCACGEPEFNIDGTYITETAYGMEDFYSEIEINGNYMDLEIEHFGETVEENEGTFTLEGDKITLKGSKSKQEFTYNADEKTIRNEEMETTWVIESLFVPSSAKQTESTEQQPAEEGTEPDPIPENVRGTYTYSDDTMNAQLTITEGDYKLTATSPANEPLEITGDAVYAGNQLLLLEDGTSITCPLDEEKGTIEYGGFTFTKE